MMIKEIIENVNLHESLLEAKLLELSARLRPILFAAGINVPMVETITQCSIVDDQVIIETEWFEMECYYTDSYRMPLSILEAVNPIEAARKYKMTCDARKLRDARAKKLAEFNVLAKELGKS